MDLAPVHSPYDGFLYFRVVVRLGGFLTSYPELDCTTCISAIRLVSVCGVWTLPKGDRESRYVEKSVRGWSCTDICFRGSYLSDLVSQVSGVNFVSNLPDSSFGCYFVYVGDWRAYVSRFGIPSSCMDSIVILVSCTLDSRGLSSVFA